MAKKNQAPAVSTIDLEAERKSSARFNTQDRIYKKLVPAFDLARNGKMKDAISLGALAINAIETSASRSNPSFAAQMTNNLRPLLKNRLVALSNGADLDEPDDFKWLQGALTFSSSSNRAKNDRKAYSA